MATTYEIHNLQRMRLYEEGSSSFALDHSGTMSDFIDIPFIEGSAQMALVTDQMEPQTNQQYLDGYPQTVLGKKSATLTFDTVLAPNGVTADDSTPSATAGAQANMLLMKIIMGAMTPVSNTLEGTKASGNGSASVFSVASLTDVDVGAWVAAGTGSNSALEVRQVETRGDSQITSTIALSGVPSNSSVIYNTSAAYPAEDPQTSCQIMVEGNEDDSAFLLQGGQGGFTISTEIGELPKISYNLKFATWTDASSVVSDMSAATFTNFSPIAFVAGEFLAPTSTSATRTVVDITSVSFAPTFDYVPVTSPSGTQTIKRWRRARTAPICEVKFTTFMDADSTDWIAARDNRTYKNVQLQMGNAAGATVTIACPRAQVVDAQLVDTGGLAGLEVTLRAGLATDHAAPSQSTELRRAPIFIVWA